MKWLRTGIFIIFSVLAFSDARSHSNGGCPYRMKPIHSFFHGVVCARSIHDINEGNYIHSVDLIDRKTLESEKLKNNPTLSPLKSEDFQVSSGNEYVNQDHATSSKESTLRATTKDNAIVSTIQASKNVAQIREKDSVTVTDNIKGNSKGSSEKSYDKASKSSERASFASTPTILNVTNARTQKIQPTISTVNDRSSERSSPFRNIFYTTTFSSHVNKNVFSTKTLTTQNNREKALFSKGDASGKNSIVVSVTNVEVTPGDEELSTVSSAERVSSSTTHSMVKTVKLVESAAISTKEEEPDVIIEAMSFTQEDANIKSIKLVFSVVFLTVATISIALLVTYMMKVRRRYTQYDEVVLLP
ncbi:uncharacterized protein LOC118197854 isoform X2 [Stegodyphus dumicola]|uniref:uncharacterized protein LOC118197854 isoform X2 n=1 Tax=Stegodyphus dumicola TaxID=202533 RepID=UPI0015AF7F98|nr:uncharacterized protein LOC118197854 isoform X2 [Stegodyphus dumicola]